MAIFGDFFVSCIFSEPRAACFKPASEIRTKATPCVEVWQTSNLRRLRLGEEKKKKDKKDKQQNENIMACPIPQCGHNYDKRTSLSLSLKTRKRSKVRLNQM